MTDLRKIRVPLASFLVFSIFFALAIPAQMSSRVGSDADPASGSNKGRSNVYIVRMQEDPVVAYKGGIPGLRATKPAKGKKINPNSPDVVKYVAHLDSRHNAALTSVGGGRKLYDYRYTYNGFTAELTEAQAAKLASTPGVVSVEADQTQYMDTSSTPTFLGLDAPGVGLWNQLGGVGKAGEDVIIGIVDSGIWPEHPSFSDRTGIGPNDQKQTGLPADSWLAR